MSSLRHLVLGSIVLASISAAAGYWFARSHGHPGFATERRALYWYDPMRPDQHFDRPGKSPFMDMQLVPKYADESRGIEVDSGTVQNLGVRYTQVERGALPQNIDAVGAVGFNQRDIAVVQARSSGFVTRVYARAPGDVVSRNAPIVDLLVPEWAAGQTEFLALLKSGDRPLMEAARQRLVLSGMPADLIERVESTRELHTTVTVRSPLAGVIETLDVRAGMTVSPGATLAKVNGLATVWVEAAIPEAQGALPQPGRKVEVRLTAYPGQTFTGRLVDILPRADAETRTVRARIEVNNPVGRLRPGMFAQVRLNSGTQIPVLYVASEAVIRTGTRTVVITAGEHERFIPTEVQAGADVDGRTIILGGLTEGQTVVASGQFLIDSEANLKAALARLGGRAER